MIFQFARVRKALKLLRRKGYRRGLWRGIGASTEHERVLRLRKWQTVVDIGANRGQFSLAVQTLCPAAKIIAFEPLTAPAKRFRGLFATNESIRLHQCAIGPARGPFEMHVSGRDDSSSLLPMAELQNQLYPGTAEVAIETVTVAPLSDVVSAADIEPPALLKLDVQGYELECLTGCVDLLDRFDYVYAECAFAELYQGQALANEVIDLLSSRGFVLAGVYNPAYDVTGAAVDGDFLFAKGQPAVRKPAQTTAHPETARAEAG